MGPAYRLLLATAHADWSALYVAVLGGRAGPRRAARCRRAARRHGRRDEDVRPPHLAHQGPAHDGELVARSQGVPGFEWQGVDLDQLPRHIAELAAAEYVAVRSMFIWLASADALSPFQDDIRDA